MSKKIIEKIREFNRFYTSITGVMNNHILESKYSLTEVRIMYEIHQNENITARRIKETLQLDEGYLSRLISKLVKQNIVNKKRLKPDNRIFSLALTKKGKEKFIQLSQHASIDVAKTIKHLSVSEQKELMQLLERAKKLLSKNNDNEFK